MLDLVLLPDDYAVCRLEADKPVPEGSAEKDRDPTYEDRERFGPWGLDAKAGLVSITWTSTEISIICRSDQAPADAVVNTPWRCVRVNGPIDLALTGILAALVNPLAEARVNIFAFSTHDTDYVLVPSVRLDEALAALERAGHRVTAEAATR